MQFDAAWPSTLARVSSLLQRRGLQSADADDVAQEVAIRAMRAAEQFESEEHLVRWCCRVAVNLHIDAIRKSGRIVGDLAIEGPGIHDTEATVERRMVLQTLATGIAELSDDERRVLFAVDAPESRKEAVRLAVRRHRLRTRLAALVEGMAAAVLFIRRLMRHASTSGKVSMVAASIVFAGLLLNPFTLGGGPRPASMASTPPRAPDPSAERAPMAATDVAVQSSPTPSTRAKARITGAPVGPRGQASSRTFVDAAPAGIPVRVSREERPGPQPLTCAGGVVTGCVDRPPILPRHIVPPLP